MNTETGLIKAMEGRLSLTQMIEKFGSKQGVPNMIPVDNNDMTLKQKEEMQVSKFDNKSILGKKFTGSRQVRRRKEREFVKASR